MLKLLTKLTIIICVMLLTISVLAQSPVSEDQELFVQNKTPQINTINVIQNGDNPLIEITGSAFGKDPNRVKVLINDNGVLLTPNQVKKKKITLQIPNSNLCTGKVKVRVIVGANSSNTGSFQYQKNAPIIYSFSPERAQTGGVLEIKADNLACQTSENIVTINDIAVPVLGINTDKLSVRIPEAFATGKVKVRVTVGNQASLAKDFVIDAGNGLPGTGGSSGEKLTFISSAPAGTTFAPMFNIRDRVIVNDAETTLWHAMFYGTHQTIINLPWQVAGQPQKALLTINVREANDIYGNFTGQKEKFVYALISFPRFPERPYQEVENPFFWGACSVVTETSPSGGFIFNSVARSGGGIDSFDLSRTASASGTATMTFRLIAPDLGRYEEYGINYDKAGSPLVKLPKALSITVEMQEIQPNIPTSYFRIGKITFRDEITGQGSSITEKAVFANTFSITDVPDFGFGMF